MPYAKRRKKLRKQIAHGDAILVTNETNVRYLTGFTGDSTYLILSANGEIETLFSDPRYDEQIAEECPGLPVFLREPSEQILDVACRELRQLGVEKLIIESGSTTIAAFETMKQANFKELVLGREEVERLRMIKDSHEIVTLSRAVEIAQRAFLSLRAQLMRHHSERELAHELERLIRSLGGDGCSFQPIVAAGARAALPHAVPTKNAIGDSSLLLIDWGATVNGYRSDLTRVLLTSRIPAKIAKAYEVVLAAQTAAIDAMRPGVSVGEIDAVARSVIADAKLAKRFNHGLGHGIGLDIHEGPKLVKAARSKGNTADRDAQLLAEGMVITVEPGVYFPGIGGIRIEDDVLITRDGVRLLSSLPRSMDENRVDFIG